MVKCVYTFIDIVYSTVCVSLTTMAKECVNFRQASNSLTIMKVLLEQTAGDADSKDRSGRIYQVPPCHRPRGDQCMILEHNCNLGE